MKFACLSDLHNDLRVVTKLFELEFDAILIAGDLTNFGTSKELKTGMITQFRRRLIIYYQSFRTQVWTSYVLARLHRYTTTLVLRRILPQKIMMPQLIKQSEHCETIRRA